jgi:hypothetical protein
MTQNDTNWFPYHCQEVKDSFGRQALFDFSSLEIGVKQHGEPQRPPLPQPIIEESSSDGSLRIVNIPESRIPSPLSREITPGTLYKLREWLVGKGKDEISIGGGKAGNGLEVWKCWKRAYALWNNFYVQGRVDPEWVRDRWKEKQRQRDEEGQYKSSRRQGEDIARKKPVVLGTVNSA